MYITNNGFFFFKGHAYNDVILACGGKTQKTNKLENSDAKQRWVSFNDKLWKIGLNFINYITSH